MRNALLPTHLYNFGNTDFQMPNWDAQMNMNRKNGFCMGSNAIESDNHNRVSGDFTLPLDQSSLLTPAPTAGYSNGAFRYYDHGFSQQPMLLDKKIDLVTQFEEDFQAIQIARKRPIIEVNDMLPKNGLGDLVGDSSPSNEWNKNKRSKVTNSQQQWHNQSQEASMEIQDSRLQVPVRRSQKLSDKITALQKLVSPYGKTDTASVLQEASVYIMLLQQQIQQNLYRMLSSSYKNAASLHSPQECGSSREVLDLRSKGLCLVPISITKKVTMEEDVDLDLSTSRRFVIANNF